jgi:hypothetical protein
VTEGIQFVQVTNALKYVLPAHEHIRLYRLLHSIRTMMIGTCVACNTKSGYSGLISNRSKPSETLAPLSLEEVYLIIEATDQVPHSRTYMLKQMGN